MTFEELVGQKLEFYGVDERKFKIGPHIFEAVCDDDDGYRSRMAGVEPRTEGAFAVRMLAKVRVEEVTRPVERKEGEPFVSIDSGYRLVGTDGHVWLAFGTDNEDDYYPSYVFSYTPKATP